MRPDMVEFNPNSQEFRTDRSGVFRELRDRGPAFLAPEQTTLVLSRYEDVVEAATEWEVFSSALFGDAPPLEILNLFDPPAHSELKSKLSRAYSPQRILALEPEIRSIARSLIGELAANGSADLVHQFVRPFTTRVMGVLLGFSDEQAAQCQHLSDAALLSNDGLMPFVPLIQELIADHRDTQRDDLMTALLRPGDAQSDALSEGAILAFCWGIILGNNCTTMDALANGIHLLASSPEQWHEVAENPSLIPQAFEEMMRCEPPTHNSQRITTEEVEFRGMTIPKGTPILLMWGAANLDERTFEDPDRFDVHRPNNHHVALGWGTHFCIGAVLAQMEARVAFEELLAAFPRVSIVGEPERIPSDWQWGLESLVLEFRK